MLSENPGNNKTSNSVIQTGDNFHSINCDPLNMKCKISTQTRGHCVQSFHAYSSPGSWILSSLGASWETSVADMKGFGQMLTVPLPLTERETILVPLRFLVEGTLVLFVELK